MNIERIFKSVEEEPMQSTLILVVEEIENQGYQVKINDKFNGSNDLYKIEETGEIETIIARNGVAIQIQKENIIQNFRLQFLDTDSICFTKSYSPSVIYDPEKTVGFYKSENIN